MWSLLRSKAIQADILINKALKGQLENIRKKETVSWASDEVGGINNYLKLSLESYYQGVH